MYNTEEISPTEYKCGSLKSEASIRHGLDRDVFVLKLKYSIPFAINFLFFETCLWCPGEHGHHNHAAAQPRQAGPGL